MLQPKDSLIRDIVLGVLYVACAIGTLVCERMLEEPSTFLFVLSIFFIVWASFVFGTNVAHLSDRKTYEKIVEKMKTKKERK